jgi:hypothetical protein
MVYLMDPHEGHEPRIVNLYSCDAKACDDPAPLWIGGRRIWQQGKIPFGQAEKAVGSSEGEGEPIPLSGSSSDVPKLREIL